MVIAPQNIQFANATGSKDKRLTMLPDQIKRFIIDSNKVRATTGAPSASQPAPQVEPAQHHAEKEQTQSSSQQLYGVAKAPARNDINMEAYNAYYNNHEQQPVATGEVGERSPS